MSEAPQNVVKEFVPHPQIPDHETDGVEYFYSTIANMKMIRKDGKHIVFHHHMFESNQSGDIDYLDEEITKHKNMTVRYASPEEIRNLKWSQDPHSVVVEDVKNDESVMAQLRAEVESQLMNSGWTPPKMDGDKLAGVDKKQENVKELSNGASMHLGPGPASKLTPVSTADLSKGAGESNSTNK
jgi:hypothetical protein